MNTKAIQCEKLNKQFADKQVLSNIDLTVDQGEYFGLVGINGSGKSTMIKAILDLLSIDSGEIELFGQSNRKVESRDKVSYLPDRFMPPSHLTGTDFIDYMLSLHSVSCDEKEINDMLAALELDNKNMRVSVSKLSKGMTQKLGLAASLLSKKPLLILDEPMSGLDPKARVLFKKQLKQRRSDIATLFFSSHVLADVDEIADKMAVLHEGQILFVGAPEEFKQTYGSSVLEEAYMNCIGHDMQGSTDTTGAGA